MNISIVNPNLSGDVSILEIGITYLVTHINQRTRHRARTIDFTFHRRDWRKHLRASLREQKPEVLGISATSLYMGYCRDIMTEARACMPGLRIVMGGWHCSVDPEDSIANYPSVEAIVIGDGEYPIAEYLDRTASGTSLEGIKGLWFRGQGGEVVRNERLPFIQNVDELPTPDYDCWMEIDKYLFYNQMLYFIANRGCPFECTYCSEAAIKKQVPGSNLRHRDARLAAREVRHQYEKYGNRGMRIAHFFDPVFPINRQWVADFTDEYKKTGLSALLPFSCFTRIDTIDEERIDLLAGANCRILRIGIEAGNEHIRNDIYHKNIAGSQYERIIGLAHRRGIRITGYNMLGGPDETWGTMRETFSMNRRLGIERPIFFTYRPLPRTAGAAQVIALGGEITHWGSVDSLHNMSNVTSARLKPWQTMCFQYLCLLYFYLRRVKRLASRQGPGFFLNFIRYFSRGVGDGVAAYYLFGYFMTCCGDNLTE